MTLSTLIPHPDLGEFGNLEDDCKREVLTLLRAMREIDAAKKTTHAIRSWAARLNRSYSRLRALYYSWKESGWRGLVNRAKYFPCARDLPVSFVDFWKEMRMQFQRDRTGKAAHDALCDKLAKWEREPWNAALRIPGYDKPPKRDAFTGLPRGWKYGNLMRMKIGGLEKAALQLGRNAALAYRAPILTSRVGLRVGQILQFDDQWYDVFINFLGVNRKTARPLGLDAIDVASASYAGHAFLPITEDAETGARVQLKAYHAEWFLAHVLMDFGYRADTGTTCVIEHGTMTAGEAFEERLELATGGKVKLQKSGIIDNKAFPGQFDGPGGGNFKMKALLEGARVILRNRMACLPGPTGKDPEHAPEEAYAGLQRTSGQLLKLLDRLPVERGVLLAHHIYEFHGFTVKALEIYDALEDARDHELEGWIGQGWVATEWRHSLESQDWRALDEINAIADETLREATRALVVQRPGFIRTRKLSRREACQTQRHELTPIRGAAVPILLGREAARVCRVMSKHPLIEVEAGEHFPEPLYYFAQLREGRVMLERGREILLYVDPFGSRRAEVCDLEGRWLGGVEFWDRPSPVEVERLGEQFGRANAAFATELQTNVPRWAMPTTTARTAIIEHNTEVVRGAAITEAEKKTASEKRAAIRAGAHIERPSAEPAAAEAEEWPEAAAPETAAQQEGEPEVW